MTGDGLDAVRRGLIGHPPLHCHIPSCYLLPPLAFFFFYLPLLAFPCFTWAPLDFYFFLLPSLAVPCIRLFPLPLLASLAFPCCSLPPLCFPMSLSFPSPAQLLPISCALCSSHRPSSTPIIDLPNLFL